MFGFSKQLALSSLVLSLSSSVSLASSSYEASAEGLLSGWDTVDYVYIDADDDQELTIGVEASGPGTNDVHVKVQQQTASGGWDTLQSAYLDTPSDFYSFYQDVKNYRSGSQEHLRVRLSRELTTKSIVWFVGVNWD